MDFKKIVCSCLCLVPVLSFADASLNIALKVQDKEVIIENAIVSSDKEGIFVADNITVKAKVLSEDENQVEVSLEVSQDGKDLVNPTVKTEWGKPATVEIVKKDKSGSEAKSVELIVVADKVE
ncbi:hypothetical protein ACFLYU_01650 [Candidatus Dependentiae bacterium]